MIWDIVMPRFPKLQQDLHCEVLVIGGGMAGILCAKLLSQRGVDTILVEGNTIGGGITRRTTAVVTAQHDTLYSQMIQDLGINTARDYLKANLQAVEQLRTLAKTVPCDWEERPSYIYSSTDRRKMAREVKAVNQLGFGAEYAAEIELPVASKGAVRFPNMAQFHPLKFLSGMAQDLTIYEDTFVRRVKGSTAYTDQGTVTAEKIVVATHYPFINRVGLYSAKLYQQRSYVIALEGAQPLTGTYVEDGADGLYFRDYGKLLLVGGSDHRTGTESAAYQPMRDFARQKYPSAVEKAAFANQDCVSLDGVSYVGRYSRLMPSLYVAAGFNLWGMTSSMVSAQLLCDLLTGEENAFARTFSPQRSMLSKQLLVNMGTTTADMLYPTTKRCPHLGCALRYNRQEHSWDCPCHGSRFAEDGRLLDNPAMEDLHG